SGRRCSRPPARSPGWRWCSSPPTCSRRRMAEPTGWAPPQPTRWEAKPESTRRRERFRGGREPSGEEATRRHARRARQSCVLPVRDLCVEVGGRYTLTGASLTLRAGDKVGLVGRNGVGKTSLLKVLAGEAPAAHGVVARSGAIGYLSQD